MPDWRAEVGRRVRGLRLPPEREWEIVEELSQHLEDRYRMLLSAGASESEAYRNAVDDLSDGKPLGQQLLEIEKLAPAIPVILGTTRRNNMFADLIQDIRYSIRMLAKSPAITGVAVLALALGIGANTAVFSVLNGVLLRPLPYPQPERLVWLWPADARTGRWFPGAISPPDFVDYRKQSTVFENLSAFMSQNLTLSDGGEAERVPAAAVSGGFFETLGIHPAMGRSVRLEDEQTDWPRIVVLSDGLWRRRFGGDPGVLGKTINIDGKPMTIAGVMPPGFEFPKEAQIWQPLPFDFRQMKVRRFHFIRVVGRMKADVTVDQAESQMKSICAGLAKTYPDSNAIYSSKVVSLLDQMVGSTRPTLTMLMAAVAFVLLIACGNVAHLLLARAATRQREIAIRSSLGASASRVLRQLLTESVLLALIGGALGIVFSVWGLKALAQLHPANLPRLDEVHLDGTVLAFTAAISVLTGLVFGLAPAFRAARPNLTETLKEGRIGGSTGRGHRVHNALLTVEVAVAVVLLAGAGLMIRSFQQLEGVNPGFNPRDAIALRVALPMTGGGQADPKVTTARELGFFKPLLEGLHALPGVESAGLVSETPLSGQNNDTSFTVEGRPPVTPSDRPDADDRQVTPGYFSAMNIPLIKGRYFTENDNETAPKVAIVSKTFADAYFPNENPIGQHLNIDHGVGFQCEIVGVVGDVLHRSLADQPYPAMYVPFLQQPRLDSNVVIHSRTNPLTLVAAVKKQVQALNPDVPIFSVHAMSDLVADSIGQPRFRTLLLVVFAGIALLLAAAGIYGVMSYSVTLRVHEIGIRSALGASRMELMKSVVLGSMTWAMAGIVIGVGAALALTRLITSLLYGVQPSDPVSFTVVPAILFVVALAASYLPARRATKIDPVVALRME